MKNTIAKLVRHWAIPAAIVGAAIAGFVIAIKSSRKVAEPSPPPTTTELPAWGIALLIASITLLAVGIALAVEWWNRSSFKRPESRARKIETLSSSLKEALQVISNIEREVAEGNSLLEQLQKETEVKSQLARLSSAEAEAVLAQLREVVRGETGRGTRLQIAINLLFFLGGVAATLLVGRL